MSRNTLGHTRPVTGLHTFFYLSHSYRMTEGFPPDYTVSRLEDSNLRSYPHENFKYRDLDLKSRQVTMNTVFRQKARRNEKKNCCNPQRKSKLLDVILTTLKFKQASSASVKEGRGELHSGCEE
jgi:hypothetical protein